MLGLLFCYWLGVSYFDKTENQALKKKLKSARCLVAVLAFAVVIVLGIVIGLLALLFMLRNLGGETVLKPCGVFSQGPSAYEDVLGKLGII